MKADWNNEEWSKIIFDNLPDEMLSIVPKDIDTYCLGFSTMSKDARKRFYVNLFSCLARYESSFNPKATYAESFKDRNGKSVISTGLFQVSVESLSGYGFKITQEKLFDPETNIKAMITVAKKWIVQDGVIASDKAPWKGMSRYWSPFRSAAKKEAISRKTRSTSYMAPPPNEIEETVYDKFLTVAKSQMGIHELPGKQHEKKILEYHKATSLKAVDDETPWCSSFANWVTKQCGVQGTNSAAAKSWMKWGKELKIPVVGCIVVFSRIGGGHVGFFISEDKDFIYVLGGNQSNSVNISAYRKDRLLGYRGVA